MFSSSDKCVYSSKMGVHKNYKKLIKMVRPDFKAISKLKAKINQNVDIRQTERQIHNINP